MGLLPPWEGADGGYLMLGVVFSALDVGEEGKNREPF
jgi:hypothetical protein